MIRKLINVDRKYLSPKILILMAKFSRRLYRVDGTVLRLQDNNIIEQITYHCDYASDIELHTIYTQLRLEILNVINGNQLDDSALKFYNTLENEPLTQKTH